jgi:hypothetical protein
MSWKEDFEDEMTVSKRHLAGAASEAMVELIAGLARWDLFGGLTFDQRRCPAEVIMGVKVPRRIPVDSARVRFQNFVGRAEKTLGRELKYVAALESQRNGWPHLHPLLSLEGGLQAGDVAALGGLWYDANGYGRLEAPRSLADVTGYCAKYLLKDLAIGALLISPRIERNRES